MEHTPWKVSGVHRPLDGHESCGCPPVVVVANSAARIAEVSCGWPKEESESIARLIAAAPALLKALKAGIEYDELVHQRAAENGVECDPDGAAYVTGDDLNRASENWISKARDAIALTEKS